MKNFVRIGESNGKATIIDRIGVGPVYKFIRWAVRCNCGNEYVTRTSDFRSGRGCKKCGDKVSGLSHKTHGESNTPLYKAWSRMRARCTSRSPHFFAWYGAKGIRVCEEWSEYPAFRDWALANGWAEGLVVDRLDSNRNYEPANCQLISVSENARRARLG